MDEPLQSCSSDAVSPTIQHRPSLGGSLAANLRSIAASFTTKKSGSTDALHRLVTRVFHGVADGKRLADYYELGEEVGKGAFGVVREAFDLDTGELFCCKSIPRENLTAEMFADIKLEAEIMMHLRGHPNVVEIMGLFEDETHIHIVEEMCTGGDLYSKLTKSPVPYTEVEVSVMMRTVLTVLQHCHSMGVIYRDCKPENFLLSSMGADAVLKATDFGISKFLKSGEKLTDFCGTPTYMAPEVFDMNYSFPADVWSAGVTMYWVLCGDFPFKGKNKMELARRVYSHPLSLEGGVWDQVTAEAKDLIRLMLQKEPGKRPTPAEALQHPWFKAMSGAKVKPLGNIVLQRMRAFTQMKEFKKEVLRHIAHHLEEAYLVGLRAMFNAMDKDSNGSLTTEEVHKALELEGVKMELSEVQTIMTAVDEEHPDEINFVAFVSATISSSILERKELLQSTFDHYDRDRDGVISLEELQVALRISKISEKKIARIVSEIQKSTSDGSIDFAEFCDMMLESKEQGREGFKMRWRIRNKADENVIFKPRRKSSMLPNLAELGSRSSAAGSVANTVGNKTAFAQTQQANHTSTNSPARHLTSDRRSRSTSVAGITVDVPTFQPSLGASFLRRVSMTANGAKPGPDSPDSTSGSPQLVKLGTLTRSFASSREESSKIAAFLQKVSPFKVLAQVSKSRATSPTRSHGNMDTVIEHARESQSSSACPASPRSPGIVRISADPQAHRSSGSPGGAIRRTSSPARPPSSLKKTSMIKPMQTATSDTFSPEIDGMVPPDVMAANASQSGAKGSKTGKRLSWSPLVTAQGETAADTAFAAAVAAMESHAVCDRPTHGSSDSTDAALWAAQQHPEDLHPATHDASSCAHTSPVILLPLPPCSIYTQQQQQQQQQSLTQPQSPPQPDQAPATHSGTLVSRPCSPTPTALQQEGFLTYEAQILQQNLDVGGVPLARQGSDHSGRLILMSGNRSGSARRISGTAPSITGLPNPSDSLFLATSTSQPGSAQHLSQGPTPSIHLQPAGKQTTGASPTCVLDSQLSEQGPDTPTHSTMKGLFSPPSATDCTQLLHLQSSQDMHSAASLPLQQSPSGNIRDAMLKAARSPTLQSDMQQGGMDALVPSRSQHSFSTMTAPRSPAKVSGMGVRQHSAEPMPHRLAERSSPPLVAHAASDSTLGAVDKVHGSSKGFRSFFKLTCFTGATEKQKAA